MAQNITHARVRQVFDYNPSTGYVIWKIKPKHRAGIIEVGDRAGYSHWKGYRWITLDNKGYAEHRLIWFWVTGKWPPNQIDHKDGNKANNKWDNLRLATNGQNQANTRLRKTNTTGYKGVTYNKKQKVYIAQVCINGKVTYLGSFTTPEEAYAKRCQVTQELHGEFFNKG